MKCYQFLILCLAFLLCTTIHGQTGFSKDYQNALKFGAKAQLTLAVVDETGQPVSNATCRIGFNDIATSIDVATGVTDKKGLFTGKGRAKWYIGGTVKKGGFYTTTFTFLDGGKPDRVNGDRWRPWNPTIAVLLKKVHKPVTMVLSYEHVQIKSFMEPTGFDLEKHDWVSPVGKGVRADVFIKFLDLGADVPYKGLALEFVGDKNGAYVKKKDNFSVLKSDYQASSKDIYERIITNTEGKRGPPHVLLGGDDYLVFRVRSKLDAEGKVLSAFYGKIYGPFDYFVAARDKIRLITFFNPEENDTNLEFDGVGYGDGSLFGR